MSYHHIDYLGNAIDLPVGKVVCIGQNYLDHIQEMNSKTAAEALFFIKPSTALVPMAPRFIIPSSQGAVHNETEIAVLLKAPLKKASVSEVLAAVWGYSLALDLTLREVQAQLKQLRSTVGNCQRLRWCLSSCWLCSCRPSRKSAAIAICVDRERAHSSTR